MTNPVKKIYLINVDILNQNVLMVKASDVVFAIHYKTFGGLLMLSPKQCQLLG